MCYQKVLLMLVLAVIGLRLSERLLRCTRKMNTHSREEKAQEETLHFFFGGLMKMEGVVPLLRSAEATLQFTWEGLHGG